MRPERPSSSGGLSTTRTVAPDPIRVATIRRNTITPRRLHLQAQAKATDADRKRSALKLDTKPVARSSALRDAQRVSSKGSAKLTDKNYKGYDAQAGKPGRKEAVNCKPRPKETKPKGAGGSGKEFVPWCERSK